MDINAHILVQPRDWRFDLDIEGATEEDLARGVAAAVAVVEAANVDPWVGARAINAMEWSMVDDLETLTDADVEAGLKYADAVEAALVAGCRNLPNTPKKYNFCLYELHEEPRKPSEDAIEVVYPTTEIGRPMEELVNDPSVKRRKLVGWNWVWATTD
jgi:hypothetical protein